LKFEIFGHPVGAKHLSGAAAVNRQRPVQMLRPGAAVAREETYPWLTLL